MYFYYIMSYSNGLLPSTTTSTNKPQRGLPGVGFKLTDNGNYDLENKLIRNLECPPDVNDDDSYENITKDKKSAVNKEYIHSKFLKKDKDGNYFDLKQNVIRNTEPYYDGLFGDNDLVSKNYVDIQNTRQNIAIADKASKNDLHSKLNIDGSNSMTSNLNLNNNKATNLSGGTDKGDAVNYGQLLEHTENHQNNYNLQPSFTFYKNFGNEGKVPRSTRIKLFSNHNHHSLNWVPKEGSDSGFGGQAWVSLKMTNNLPVGIYTVVFELFSGISDSSGGVTQLNNETLLQQVHGDANYKIITFSHDYQTTHSKAFIQFNSNGQAGEITFQIRYYGSSYNNSTLNFFFFFACPCRKTGHSF